jgi:hypothetical protein
MVSGNISYIVVSKLCIVTQPIHTQTRTRTQYTDI